jgi:hypothetical protein
MMAVAISACRVHINHYPPNSVKFAHVDIPQAVFLRHLARHVQLDIMLQLLANHNVMLVLWVFSVTKQNRFQ